jgi:hypothetical protein
MIPQESGRALECEFYNIASNGTKRVRQDTDLNSPLRRL